MNSIDRADLSFDDMPVEEDEGSQCLVLGGGGDLLLVGKPVQVCAYFACPHLVGVLILMEPDEMEDPFQIGLLGPEREVLDSDGLPDGEQKGRFHGIASLILPIYAVKIAK